MVGMEWLREWQTLIGSALGGIIALLAALVVASVQTRRERRAAAIIILGDLLAVEATATNLRKLATEQNVEDHDYPIWVSEKLSWRRPKLSGLFEAESVRLLDVHTSLAAHLTLFKTIYSTIDEGLRHIEEDKEKLQTRGLRAPPRGPEATNTDARSIADGLAVSARHAACATHYLQSLVLGPMPSFTRFRMLLWSVAVEKESNALLHKHAV